MTMTRFTRFAAVAGLSALLLAPVGCGKKDGEASGKKEAKGLATLLTGKAPTIPAVFKGLKPGMTPEEYKRIFPKMPEERSFKVPGYDVDFAAGFDDVTHILSSLSFHLPKAEALKLVTAAWGEPKATKDSIDRPQHRWFNPETGLRAILAESFSDDMILELTAYIPAAKFVGSKPGTVFGFEAARPLLGATLEDLRKAYPKALVEKTKAQAAADRKDMEKMLGKDKDKLKILGGPRASVYLELLPTEYGDFWTRVDVDFDDAQKIERFRFTLPFAAYPAFKDTLFKLLQAKLGKLTEGKDIVGDKLFTADGAGRHVEVKEDTITKGWSVTVEPAEKAKGS